MEARIWPRGAICPHCGGVERNRKMDGKRTRIGVYKCYDCCKPLTVKIGTIFEGKRGMNGVYQHCAYNHLHRYVAEFDFRCYNRNALGVEDNARAERLLLGARGNLSLGERDTIRKSPSQNVGAVNRTERLVAKWG